MSPAMLVRAVFVTWTRWPQRQAEARLARTSRRKATSERRAEAVARRPNSSAKDGILSAADGSSFDTVRPSPAEQTARQIHARLAGKSSSLGQEKRGLRHRDRLSSPDQIPPQSCLTGQAALHSRENKTHSQLPRPRDATGHTCRRRQNSICQRLGAWVPKRR